MSKTTHRKKKIGRPKGERPPLGTITLRVDAATKEAIDKLAAAAVTPGVVVTRANAIRTALIRAAAQLDDKGGQS